MTYAFFESNNEFNAMLYALCALRFTLRTTPTARPVFRWARRALG